MPERWFFIGILPFGTAVIFDIIINYFQDVHGKNHLRKWFEGCFASTVQ